RRTFRVRPARPNFRYRSIPGTVPLKKGADDSVALEGHHPLIAEFAKSVVQRSSQGMVNREQGMLMRSLWSIRPDKYLRKNEDICRRNGQPLPLDLGTCWSVIKPVDGDRGEPRGSSPPTPPGIRVRTRRFDRVERSAV